MRDDSIICPRCGSIMWEGFLGDHECPRCGETHSIGDYRKWEEEKEQRERREREKYEERKRRHEEWVENMDRYMNPEFYD